MAEGETNASTQQQDGSGEAKTDAQNADHKAQGDGSGAGNAEAAKADGGTRSGDAKPDAGKPDAKPDAKADGDAKPAVPEKYDLKLSDDSLLDPKVVDRIATIAREQGLSNEDAQAHLAAVESEAMKERNARVTEWNEALKADKELGGANYEATVQSASRYANWLKEKHPDLLTMLEKTGYANNPAVVRYLREQGNRMKDDKHEGKSSGQPKKEKAPVENRLFPNSPPPAQKAARNS